MIELQQVTFQYQDGTKPQLRDVDLTIPEGELAVVVGATGTGKSTLLGLINGLVPHFTGGRLQGRVVVDGRSTAEFPPREMADVVGLVRQDPAAGFVTDVVEDELAYTMESLGVPADVMRRRVEETLDLLGLDRLRNRALRTLSGGERQRVAIGSVLTAHPRILVLDEPTSALDPQAAEEVLAAIQRLVHDLGLTVVVSEHRLERVVQYADTVLIVHGDGTVSRHTDPSEAMSVSPVEPPLATLGKRVGWDPLPLSTRDARRAAADLRQSLPPMPPLPAVAEPGPTVAQVAKLAVVRSGAPVLRSIDLQVNAGEIVAVIGRNGAGKTTLLRSFAGSQSPDSGTVQVRGMDPVELSGKELVAKVGFVPQEPATMLWAESVAAECESADTTSDLAPGTTLALFQTLRNDIDPLTHPMDLSEGTRLALVVALVAAGAPDLLLLDEPTRGLDYCAKSELADVLREHALRGAAIVLATHDVELVAEACTRVVMLGDGDVVLDTDARSAATASPAFAPQVAKVFAPLQYLTAAEVTAGVLAQRDSGAKQ